MKRKIKRSISILMTAMFLTAAFSVSAPKAEEAKVTGSAAAGVFSKYVFRGYELSSDSVLVQPSIGIAYKGFSASLWGNIDSKENPTQSFVPDRLNQKSFNETDLTLSYTYAIDKLSLTAGYIYYGTKYAAETEELFVTAGYDTLLKPVLSVYRDVTEYPGTYINIAVSHSMPVYNDINLDLAASAGYFIGSGNYWKTYESSTGSYTGEKYSALHDGMLKAGFTIPVAATLTVQPVVQYYFPLSAKAKRTVDGNSYNFNGKLDDTLLGGVNLTLSF
ncbi:MAG: TorF family putative porin [Thermodesulfovibrionia bacterium]|nr:TorF family putative porin [Thermodesulfovibrionia bacterium]